MANYRFTSEILDDVLFRAGEPTDATSDWEAMVLAYLNRAYRAIWKGGSELDPTVNEDWLWLRQTGLLTLEAKITAGTVGVTKNSTAITFSSAPVASVAGYHFKVDSHRDVFMVSAHTAGVGAATLDSAYTGETNAAAAYRVIRLEYPLATDMVEIFSPIWMQRSAAVWPRHRGRIEGVDEQALRQMWPMDDIRESIPSQFAMVGDQKIRFNSYPSDLVRIEYRYKFQPADLTDSASEEPVIPLRHRATLADWALFFLMEDKVDTRAPAIATLAKAGLRAMAMENRRKAIEIGSSFGAIYPRLGQVMSLPR